MAVHHPTPTTSRSPRCHKRATMLAFALSLPLGACGTMNAARPLAPGEHAMGLTFGGAMVDLGAPIPLPNLVVEGRHGLAPLAGKPFDVHYGLNLTALGFGAGVIHGGGAWQFVEGVGARPALTVADRAFFVDNHLNLARVPEARAFYALNQLDLLASWEISRTLVYTGVSDVFDPWKPSLLIGPILGAEVGLGKSRKTRLQLEVRDQGAFREAETTAIPWVSPGRGALSVTFGANFRLGGANTSTTTPEVQ
jgi:hypothetical protein